MVPLSARANGPKATILVVDDSPAMLRYLRLLLEIDSYQVETASNGADAVRRIRQGYSPAVILLDLQMPGMDGLKTLRRLLKLQPDLNVIMCSGVDDPIKVQQATVLGAKAYLTKPVRHLYLSAAVERCLDSIPVAETETKSRGSVITLPPPARCDSN
jgi:two-component system, chemotaxis family, chemotaxis protein CheY